ncbi:MAG TPA: condensation domain-containing protein, partial [Longimicrobiaceae bacterium]|nr:condensation domain-containing protein [Longimicrobiaceae bacterium]
MKIDAIRQLEALGASVHAAAVDVSDEAELRAFLTSYEEEAWPPIRGVVHAAGVIDDRTLRQLDSAALDAALRPKVRGGWLLHRLLQGAPLDFFVLFSSAASLIGSAGQGNYAAANAFLDALAHCRRREGLPALSLNWGPWSEVGMAARADLEERRARTGMGTIPPRKGVELFGHLLHLDTAQVGVVPLAPERLRQLLPQDTPWLSELPLELHRRSVHDEEPVVREQILAARAAERRGLMLDHLQRRIAGIIVTDRAAVLPGHSVMQLGMDSLMIIELIRALNRDLQLTLYPREIFERPSIESLAEYLLAELQRTVQTASNFAVPTVESAGSPVASPRRASRAEALPGVRNPGSAFLLSSPRSGSTLLRVMLAGHPDLFCPPELHLLPFDDLAEWQAGLGGSYLGEGLQRALMELIGLDPGRSRSLLAGWIEEKLPVQEVYRRLQELAAPRRLVDKSPSYAADAGTLERAESMFENARYVHLVRHPYAVVDSFVRTRVDRLVESSGADPHATAEQAWSVTNRNTLDFLARIDPARHHRVRYEELVTEPERVMRELCAFLEIPFVPELLAPYQGNRMTDGVHEQSLAIGDPHFASHSTIDASLADVWREVRLPRPLSGAACRLAVELGYEIPTSETAPLPVKAGNCRVPLSFSQQRLFVLEQLDPGTSTYILPAVLRVKGALNVEALERSLRAILERHEVLRTRLVAEEGQPFQEIAELNGFALPIDDLAAMPEESREATARRRVRELLRRPFALDGDLKLRTHLLRLGETEHLLVVAMHHIASDGSSVEIFLRELTSLYEAFAAGNPSPLPALPFQYTDFAQWQRQHLQGTLLESQLAYWRERLADLPALELPTDRPRPPIQTHGGEARTWIAPASLIDALKRLSRQQNVTLFMTLLGAFKLLLSRLSGQEDVAVGSPVAGRHHAGTESLIGFFLNNL